MTVLGLLYLAEPILGFIPHAGTAVQTYGLHRLRAAGPRPARPPPARFPRPAAPGGGGPGPPWFSPPCPPLSWPPAPSGCGGAISPPGGGGGHAHPPA